MATSRPPDPSNVGGQALIEGVMMRSPRHFAAVLRRADGSLLLREHRMPDARRGARAWPLIRGVVGLVDALRLGSAALRFSAEVYERDRTGTGGPPPGPIASLLPLYLVHPADAFGSSARRAGIPIVSLLFALVLFVVLPQAVAAGAGWLLNWGGDVRSVGFQLLTGASKLLIILAYVTAIRRIPEVYRVFQYHGAEHKAVNTYERGAALIVSEARTASTLHARCGTTFLVMVALVSVAVFSALTPLLPSPGLGGWLDNAIFLLLKLPALPVIAAITFELQRGFARLADGPARFLSWPGFAVQRLTTIEPDDAQLEVALTALRATLRRETGEAPSPERPLESHFKSFAEFGRAVAASGNAAPNPEAPTERPSH